MHFAFAMSTLEPPTMSAEDVENTVKGWSRWMERLPAEIVRMNEEIARLNDSSIVTGRKLGKPGRRSSD